jgi:hypothetical protein
MSDHIGDPGHGHSPAAWTSVIIMLIAFAIGTGAFFFEVVWLVWASVVLLVIGAILWPLLSKVGYGVGGSKVGASGH